MMKDEYGFTDIKFKGGVLDPDVEIATIKAFAGGVPELACPHRPKLRLDRGDFDPGGRGATGRRAGRRGYLEDPAAGIDGMAAVRQGLLAKGVSTPLASNVAVTSFAHMPESIRTDAVQVVLCDHHFWGGMRQVQQLGKLCQTFGIALSMHSNSHLGVSLMAMTHVAAATPNLTYACDTHYPWQWSDEIVAGGRVKIEDGKVAIPAKGGLGVELDYDALARLKERYEQCPLPQTGTMRPRCENTSTQPGSASCRAGRRGKAKRVLLEGEPIEETPGRGASGR